MNLRSRLQKLEEAARREPAEAPVFRLTDEQRASALANIAKDLATSGVTPQEKLAALWRRSHEVYGEPSNEQVAREVALDRRVGELLRADAMEQAP